MQMLTCVVAAPQVPPPAAQPPPPGSPPAAPAPHPEAPAPETPAADPAAPAAPAAANASAAASPAGASAADPCKGTDMMACVTKINNQIKAAQELLNTVSTDLEKVIRRVYTQHTLELTSIAGLFPTENPQIN